MAKRKQEEISECIYHPYAKCTPADSDSWLKADNDKEILARLEMILEIEAPITEHLLIKRLINSYGIIRNASRIREKMTRILKQLPCQKTKEGNTPVYWTEDQDPKQYCVYRIAKKEDEKRDVLDIPYAEAANALAAVQNRYPSMPEDALKKEASILLGYRSMKGNVSAVMDQSMKYFKKKQA